MPTHISWSSIELLHNVVRTLGILKENTGAEFPCVSYRAKVKLHGTNCAVQVRPEGVFAQSRTGMITPADDYKGFARWVASVEHRLSTLAPGVTVFGEWCGPGIESGVAVGKLTRKVFAVFAVQVGYGADAQVVYDPDVLRSMFATPAFEHLDVHVLPWYGSEFTIDYRDRTSLDAAAEALNRDVAAVEAEDPWVKATFGVSGVGEGLVLYPVAVNGGAPSAEPEALAQLMFKAKGAQHRVTAAKAAVTVNAEVVASVDAFVALMLTQARLEQGVQAACGGVREPKGTGKFLAWVSADVRKESVAELEASGLTWPQVEKAVQTKAREWFLAR